MTSFVGRGCGGTNFAAVEDVDCGGVTRPQIVIAIAEREFAVGRSEIVQSATDFDYPSVVQPDLPVVQRCRVIDLQSDAVFGQATFQLVQHFLLPVAVFLPSQHVDPLQIPAAEDEQFAQSQQIVHLIRPESMKID